MYHRILVPLDGSLTANQGLSEAIKLAKDQRGRLRLLHIADERIVDCGYGPGTYGGELIESARVDGHKILSEAQALAQRGGLHAEALLVESMGGPVAALIIEQAKAWPADLIVMGTHGRRGFGRLAMGSDAESVVRGTPVPVLLVRSTTAQPVAATDARTVNSSLGASA
jgi:nucleotide-binding universal stress UspA family protein